MSQQPEICQQSEPSPRDPQARFGHGHTHTEQSACRLWRARKCALQKEAGLYGPSAEAEEGGNEALPRLEGQGMAAQTHAAFMSLLSNLIDGHQDAGAYEDACRALLGEQLDLLPSGLAALQ